jgi:hypothetical protein
MRDSGGPRYRCPQASGGRMGVEYEGTGGKRCDNSSDALQFDPRSFDPSIPATRSSSKIGMDAVVPIGSLEEYKYS